MFSEDLVVLPGVGFLMQLHLLLKQVHLLPLLIHPLPASARGFLVAVAADSLAAAVAEHLLAAAVVACDPSCLASVVGSWLVPQHPTAGLLTEVVHHLPAGLAGAAAELEVATVTEGHLAAFLLAFPVVVDLTLSCQQLPEPEGAFPGLQCGACPSGPGCSGGEDVGVSCPPDPSHVSGLGLGPSVSGSLLGAGFLGLFLQQREGALAAGLVQAWTPGPGWVVAVAGVGWLDPVQVSPGTGGEERVQVVWGCMEANHRGGAAAAGVVGHWEAAAGAEAPSAAEVSSSSPHHHQQPLAETDGDGVEGAWYLLAAEPAVAVLEFPFLPFHPSQLPAAEKVQACSPV